MITYTYSKARQSLSELLDLAKKEGKVLIRRRDGTCFSVQIEQSSDSPLDVVGIDTSVTTAEIVDFVRKSRKASARC